MTDTLRTECEELCEKLDKAFVCNRSTLGESVEILMAFARAQQAKGLREVAEIIRITFPKAHTYASENADVYRAQDDTVKAIVHKLEAQATAREQQP